MTVNKEDLGVDPLTNIRTFRVTDAATGEESRESRRSAGGSWRRDRRRSPDRGGARMTPHPPSDSPRFGH